jgi:acyl-CoA dehydrogenase
MAAGAMESVARLTIDYTHARHQFGRPVAAFQAVQQHLVTVAQCAVQVALAADLATAAVAAGDGEFEVAAARVVTERAILEGTRAAHQAHGAMGVTREYPLHLFTRRLWSWRHEYRAARHWRRDLARQVAVAGADDFFATVTRTG